MNMKNINKILFLGILISSALFYSCDTEEESIGFTPGSNLLIAGESSFLAFESETYNVEGFTIDETYTWSITGPGTASVTEVAGREGEFVSVTAEDEGLYTLTVSNGTLDGSYTIDVGTVNEFLGVGTDTLSLSENQYNGNGDTLFLPVNISERNVFETTATFSVVNGTAIEGEDFEIVNETNTLTFAAGETQAFVEVFLLDNETIDGERSFSIVLDEITSTGQKSTAVELAPDSLKVGQSVIFIDDDLKYIGLDVATDSMEVNSAGNYFLDVTLSKAVAEDLTITYSVTDENGIPLTTVDKSNGSVEIFAGQTSAQITLDILDSFVEEGAAGTFITVELLSIISSDDEVLFGDNVDFVIEAKPAE